MTLTTAEKLQLFAVCLLSGKERLALDAKRFGHLEPLIAAIISDPKGQLRELLATENINWNWTEKVLPSLAENLAVSSNAAFNAARLKKSMEYLSASEKWPHLFNDASEILKAAKVIIEIIGE